MNPLGQDPAVLLRVDHRLRALARELLRDPGEAEDLAQETWLAALESGHVHSLPAWVTTVVRRLALDRRQASQRRERREAEAARAEALPAAVEILEREEARRRVVEALLALDEPLKTTLVLRFLEELPPRAVAARTGVPIETVRSRTRRGLEVLRERLDRSFGQRASWCTALLPILRRPSAAEALSTALVVMSIQKKLALVVLLSALGWLAWPRGERVAEPVAALGVDAPAVLEEPLRDGEAELIAAPEPAARAERTPAAEDPRRAEPFGSLRVRVSWFDGTPAAAIAVSARQEGSENPELHRREASTDAAGIAFFPRVPEGRALVVLDRGVSSPAMIDAGEEATLELVIPRGIDVLGTVEDTGGVPIPDAEVWMSWNGLLIDGTLAARSGAGGRFRLRSLRDQTLLGACAAGYRPSKPEYLGGDEGSEAKVRLVLGRGAGEVAGRVVDGLTGQPLAGAFVAVGDPNSMASGGDGTSFRIEPWARTLRTDEDGRFRFTGVAPGRASVVARTQGYSLARAEVEVRESGEESVELALLPESALQGHVLDENGAPVSGIHVLVGRGMDWLRASDRTAADGSFHIGALEAGATLEARVVDRTGAWVATTEFLAVAGRTSVWEARLGQLGFLRGLVLDEAGHPLEGWRVELFDDEHGRADQATTDPRGSFHFEDLQPSGHGIEVFDPSTMSRYSGLFAALRVSGVRPSTKELVLRVPAASMPSAYIVGAFLDEQGQPMPGAEVMPWHGSGGGSSPLLCEEATGRFEFGPFPPGRWRLNLTAPGRPTVFLGPRELAPGETWDCGDVRLAPVGRVVVRLVPDRLEHELAEGLRMRIRQGGWWRLEGLKSTDPLTRTAELPPGRYEILVFGGSYDELVVPFEIRSGEETAVDVPLRPGLLATVRVKLADPFVTTVELDLRPDGNPIGLYKLLGRSKDGDFVETFHLAPGTYTVEASAQGRRATGELVVAPVVEPAANVLELALD
jgi:RNA polymerase sigma factor (sigma-70 family)